MPRIAVTGAGGAIGGHVARLLAERGTHDVVAVVRRERPAHRGVTTTVAAYEDLAALRAALRDVDVLVFVSSDGDVVGRLGNRTGSFVLRGDGTSDGTTARGEYVVVPGSGTGDLGRLSGAATSVSTHADYPHIPLSLDYDVR